MVAFGESHEKLAALAVKLGLELKQEATPLIGQCVTQLTEYFAGSRREFSLPLLRRGTVFQLKAWDALMTIPYGATITYKQLAALAGNPRAVRAVAQAIGNNPLAIVCPCHRVVASDGTMGGYAGGPEKKQFLLELEAKHK